MTFCLPSAAALHLGIPRPIREAGRTSLFLSLSGAGTNEGTSLDSVRLSDHSHGSSFGKEMHSFVENPSSDFVPASSSDLFSLFLRFFRPNGRTDGREVLNRAGKLASKG